MVVQVIDPVMYDLRMLVCFTRSCDGMSCDSRSFYEILG